MLGSVSLNTTDVAALKVDENFISSLEDKAMILRHLYPKNSNLSQLNVEHAFNPDQIVGLVMSKDRYCRSFCSEFPFDVRFELN